MRSSCGAALRSAMTVGGVGVVLAEGVGGGRLLLLGRLGGQALEHVVGPAEQLGAVFGADSERVADHDHREGSGDVVDEVGTAPLDHGVEDLRAGLPHLRLAVPHPSRREALVDELAPLEVVGIVHVDHHRQRRSWLGRMPPALENTSGWRDTSLMSA